MVGDILEVLLVLGVGAPMGWLSQRLNFPNAVAQVVLGVLLGSAILGWVEHSALLHAFGEIGVVLLLGVAGVKLGIKRLEAAGWAGIAVALLGVSLSLLGGYLVGVLFGSPNEESIYLALALAATSIGITVQILEQYNLVGRRVADIVIAAAVLDDVIALYFLSAAHGILTEGLSIPAALRYFLMASIALTALFLAGRFITQLTMRLGWLSGNAIRYLWVSAAIAIGAIVTHWLGMSSVVGAFFGGVAVGEGLGDERRSQSANGLTPLVWTLMPFFFVMIGVQAQWQSLTELAALGFVAVLIVVAIASKAAGGMLVGLPVKGWRERWIIGFGMVPRGEVGLIVATLGYEQGHLSEAVFVAVVLATIVVSVLGPVFLAPVASHLERVSCNA